MTEKIHPHEVMADFVNKYESQIKPYLKKEDLDSIRFVIGDVVMRGAIYFEDSMMMPPAKRGSYERYRMALQYLGGLMREENLEKKSLECIFDSVDRFVADLDLILHDETHYKKFREELK